MEKMLKVVAICFFGSMLMQASCSDNESGTTTPKKVSYSFRAEEEVVGFLSGSITVSSEDFQKDIDNSYDSVTTPCQNLQNDIGNQDDLPVTPLARKAAVLFGSREEVAIYQDAKNQRLHQRILLQRQKKSIEILSLTTEQKELFLQGYEKRKAKELQEKRKAAGCCFCCFLGAVLLSDIATDSKGCQTSFCFAPKIKQKMT